MRRRVVCGLSETIATLPPQSAFTSVDLPTFGRPATATKPDFTAGSRCRAGARRRRVRRRSTRPRGGSRRARSCHSCSHWRQPPHGDAVMPIASMSPGRTPSLAAFEIAVRSAQTPERIRRVLDVDAVDERAVASRAASRRRDSSSTAHTPAPTRLRPLDELLAPSRKHLEDDERHERAEQRRRRRPRAPSGCPASTRVCATSSAMMNVIDEIRKRCWSLIDVRRRHPAGERDRRVARREAAAQRRAAAGPRLGRDHDQDHAARARSSVISAGASRTRSRTRALRSPTCGEDEVADGDRVHRRDQDGAGSDVLGELRVRVERASSPRRSPPRSPS